MKRKMKHIGLLAFLLVFWGCDSITNIDNYYLSTLPYIQSDYRSTMNWTCANDDVSETYALRKRMARRRFNFIYGKDVRDIRKKIVGKEIPYVTSEKIDYSIDGTIKIVEVSYSGIAYIEYTIVSKSDHLPDAIYVYIPINNSALDVLEPIFLTTEQQKAKTVTLKQPLIISYNFLGWCKFFDSVGFISKKEHIKFEKMASQDSANKKWVWRDEK